MILTSMTVSVTVFFQCCLKKTFNFLLEVVGGRGGGGGGGGGYTSRLVTRQGVGFEVGGTYGGSEATGD